MEYPIRLNKYLSLCGLGSRRGCERLIREGKVSLNGLTVTNLATVVQEKDQVAVEGKVVKPLLENVHLVLNKPKGVICTRSDPHHKRTIFDFLPGHLTLKYAGRLDKDTTGALILSTDGELIHRLTHPSYQIERVYRVRLDHDIDEKDMQKVKQGVKIGDRIARGSIAYLNKKERNRVLLTLKEGFKHEVKLIFKTLGFQVLDLHRESFAGISTKGLKPGEWRLLSDNELQSLREKTGMLDGEKGDKS